MLSAAEMIELPMLIRPLPVLMSLLPSLAMAQNAMPPQDMGSSVVQLLAGLAIVLILLMGSLWLLKRLSNPRGQAAGLMRVVAGTAVGPRERVVILEVGSSWIVLGVAPGQVSTLAEIPRQETPPPQSETTSTKDFATWLKQMVSRRHGS
jgi:flagellar protein FliO/FliZ